MNNTLKRQDKPKSIEQFTRRQIGVPLALIMNLRMSKLVRHNGIKVMEEAHSDDNAWPTEIRG